MTLKISQIVNNASGLATWPNDHSEKTISLMHDNLWPLLKSGLLHMIVLLKINLL